MAALGLVSRVTPVRREARLGSCTERENLHGDAKGKGLIGLVLDLVPESEKEIMLLPRGHLSGPN